MADVAFLPEAEADYQAAWAWYNERSSKAADNFESAVNEALEQLGRTPRLGSAIDDRHRRHLLQRFPYSCVYRIEPSGILIVAVAHGRRASAFWQDRT